MSRAWFSLSVFLAFLFGCPPLSAQDALHSERSDYMAMVSLTTLIEASLLCFERFSIPESYRKNFVSGVLSLKGDDGYTILNSSQWQKIRKEHFMSSMIEFHITRNGGCKDIVLKALDADNSYGEAIPLRGKGEDDPFSL